MNKELKMSRRDDDDVLSFFTAVGLIAAAIMITVWLTGCAATPASPPVVAKPAPARPIEVPAVPPTALPDPKFISKPYKAEWPNAEWTAILADALEEYGAPLLSYNQPAECTYPKLYWTGLIVALAKYESGWNPAVTYTENFKDNQGEFIVSRGLLQISKESANGYGCAIKDAKELADARTNLRCGVRILAKWVPKDHTVADGAKGAWFGAARYWSPFRVGAKRSVILTKAAEACK